MLDLDQDNAARQRAAEAARNAERAHLAAKMPHRRRAVAQDDPATLALFAPHMEPRLL